MSPVEPRPLRMGTMALPSSSVFEGLCFLPKMPAAFSSAGATRPPVRAPSAARNERRFQAKCRFIAVLPSLRSYFSAGAGGFTTRALPTISISESPGIHSTAMHARDGALIGEEIGRRALGLGGRSDAGPGQHFGDELDAFTVVV